VSRFRYRVRRATQLKLQRRLFRGDATSFSVYQEADDATHASLHCVVEPAFSPGLALLLAQSGQAPIPRNCFAFPHSAGAVTGPRDTASNSVVI